MYLNFNYFSLDPDQKENLIEIIDKLLRDRTTVSLEFIFNLRAFFLKNTMLHIIQIFIIKIAMSNLFDSSRRKRKFN